MVYIFSVYGLYVVMCARQTFEETAWDWENIQKDETRENDF